MNDLARSVKRIGARVHAKTPCDRGAFTLVELVVVLVIIGVVAGVSAPLLNLGRVETAEEAVRDVTQLLNRARNTALSATIDVTVTVDPVSHRVWIRAPRARPELDTVLTLALPADAALSSTTPRPRFRFDATGRASGDELVVSTSRGRSAVSIEPFSGNIRVNTVGVSAAGNASR